MDAVRTAYEFISNGPAQTRRLGERLGAGIRQGVLLALIAELGGGKTCFTKGLCAGLGVPQAQVISPTFVLANEYHGRLPVYHLDLYRIDTVEAALELGILDYLDRTGEGVVVVEWAEKIAALLPGERIEVRLSVLSARRRRVTLTGIGEGPARLIEDLRK